MMKVLTVFACLLAATAAYPKHHARDQIDLTPLLNFDRLVSYLKNHDPVHVESETVFDFLGMHLKVNDVHLEGFSSITGNLSLSVSHPQNTLSFELTLRELSATVGSFDAKTPIVYGNGSASFNLKNARISLTLGYSNVDGLVLAPIVAITSVESARASITGLNNDEDLSQSISETVSNFFNNVVNSPVAHKVIGKAIDIVLNLILNMKN